jgi:2-oxoglutarate ferredoxin oxidoreductase subunit delta
MPERIKHAPLDSKELKHPTGEIHLIKDQCQGCGYCREFCPKGVFEESTEINAKGVHPPRITDESKCILCRFCTAVCPDFAVYVIERQSNEEGKT